MFNSSDGEVERLRHTLNVVIFSAMGIIIMCSVLCLLAFLIVIFLICKRGNYKSLPLKIKVILFLFILLEMFCLYQSAMEVSQRNFYILAFNSWGLIGITIVTSLWLTIHWQFTAYYLQTACLLTIIINLRSETELGKV